MTGSGLKIPLTAPVEPVVPPRRQLSAILFADVAYALLDPRVSYEGAGS